MLFAVSRVSIPSIIREVSHAVTAFLGPQLIKLLKTELEVKELVNKFLETHGFPQCIEGIDCTNTEIKEPNKHYSNYINRKGYYSINMQTVHYYGYCFLDVVVKWPGSVPEYF